MSALVICGSFSRLSGEHRRPIRFQEGVSGGRRTMPAPSSRPLVQQRGKSRPSSPQASRGLDNMPAVCRCGLAPNFIATGTLRRTGDRTCFDRSPTNNLRSMPRPYPSPSVSASTWILAVSNPVTPGSSRFSCLTVHPIHAEIPADIRAESGCCLQWTRQPSLPLSEDANAGRKKVETARRNRWEAMSSLESVPVN